MSIEYDFCTSLNHYCIALHYMFCPPHNKNYRALVIKLSIIYDICSLLHCKDLIDLHYKAFRISVLLFGHTNISNCTKLNIFLLSLVHWIKLGCFFPPQLWAPYSPLSYCMSICICQLYRVDNVKSVHNLNMNKSLKALLLAKKVP